MARTMEVIVFPSGFVLHRSWSSKDISEENLSMASLGVGDMSNGYLVRTPCLRCGGNMREPGPVARLAEGSWRQCVERLLAA